MCCKLTSISFSLILCVFPNTINWLLEKLENVRLLVVRITEEELGCLFSCAISLEKLEVSQCDGITCFKVPSHLQQLSVLPVFRCRNLQMIEIYAPKVSTFSFRGPPTKISISNSSQLKNMSMNGAFCSGMFHHVLTKLHSIASNLQTLTLLSSKEVCVDFYIVYIYLFLFQSSNCQPLYMVLVPWNVTNISISLQALDMPAQPDKFLHLRHLEVYCCSMKCFDFFFIGFFSQSLSCTGKLPLVGKYMLTSQR